MNAQTAHTPTPWTIYPISNTFKIGTPDMEAFVQRNGYLAGKPFVAEMNVDFSGDAQHEQARLTKRYDRINNVELAHANAAFICEAVNSHALLVERNERMRAELDKIAHFDWSAAATQRDASDTMQRIARAALNPPPTK